MSEENNTQTREVLLVVETSYHYYIPNTLSDEEALDKAREMLDKGEPDQNASAGWMKELSNSVNVIDKLPETCNTVAKDGPIDDSLEFVAPC